MEHAAILRHNRDAWSARVAGGDRWTVPVDAATVAAARAGRWSILLTPGRPVPADWWPPLGGAAVLGLAASGGQQAPILAAAGARVTVLDNCPAQLATDRAVAERERLAITTVLGNMADLSPFADASFDCVVNPASNCFVPDLAPVWRECARVLRPGGVLLVGFSNPVRYLFDEDAVDRGDFVVRHRLPYADVDHAAVVARRRAEQDALEWSHGLESQIGGQCAAGFLITHLLEDLSGDGDPFNDWLPTFLLTRAVKPRAAPATPERSPCP